jgi:hypothetical protein
MELLRGLLKSKLFWAAAIVVALIGVYALLGFQVAPKLVRSQAVEYVRETYGRELAIGEVRIHPFKLQAEIRDVALPDADGSKMLAFARLFIDFELSSLWQRAYVFKEVLLESPFARAVIRPDGSLNFADLSPPDEPEEEGPLPHVWIQRFALSDGTVDVADLQRRRPLERAFAPVAFELRDFRTTPEGGGFGLDAKSRNGEQFQWRGQFALEPQISSNGEFTIAGLLVTNVAELAGDALPFALPRGTIDLAGTYSVALPKDAPLQLEVSLPSVAVRDVALQPHGIAEDWVTVPSLTVTDTRLAMPAQTIALGEIALDGLRMQAWMNADGSLSTDQLFAGPPAEPVAATGPTAAASPNAGPAAAPAGDPEWSLTVGRVALREAAIEFEDRTVSPAVRFAMAPLNASLREASLDLSRPLPVGFETTINGTAQASGTGTLVPDPLEADVDVKLAAFPVTTLQPYVASATDMTIRSGTVSAAGKFGLAPPGREQAEMSFAGDVQIAGFRSIDNALEQDFLNFERVELQKLVFALAPDRLSIDRVDVLKPFGRVIVGSDGIINLSAVLDPVGTAAAAAEARAAAAAKAVEGSRKKTRAEIRAEKKAAEAAAEARRSAPPPPREELRETGMPIRIREVALRGGTMDFADYSVQPNFAAAIQALSGTVTGLSTDPNSRATVALEGNVGEFSPVHIAGTLQPFAFDRYADIGLRFENISLPVFNPYSGKFAGYNIAKGKLFTDLNYKIADRKLDARHHVRIDQLEWGEETATQGEATLPVKFATSLLKDANGVIELDIPVTGTLDDPKFRIGPIVWQVIKNILTKAVTAPFKALGNLFKGAEEAQFVEFAAGDATLDPALAANLTALGNSLAPKSELKLDVPVATVAELDGKALAERRYAELLQQAVAGTRAGGKRAEGAGPPSFDTLTDEHKLEALTALYTKLAGAAPVPPAAPPAAEGVSRKEAAAQAQQATIAWLEQESRARATALPEDLERLAEARAAAIQKAIIDGTGMPPERVFLARNDKAAANGERVRLELAVR